MSQRELAEAVGIKASHVAYIESGQRGPSISLINRLSESLGLDAKELLVLAHPEVKQMMMAAMKMIPPTPTESIDRTIAGVMTFNALDRLGQIKCPVLIVHGDKDLLIPPENAHLIKARIPQAEMFMIPNAGHAFQAADLVGIHERIVQFLKA